MAVKGLILIKGGKETVVKDTPAVRKFWEDYNETLKGSKVAHNNYVTILEADEKTVAEHLAPPIQPRRKKAGGVIPATVLENEALRMQIAELRLEMQQLKTQIKPAKVSDFD